MATLDEAKDKRITDHISAYGDITTREVGAMLMVSDEAARKRLRRLVREGTIERQGEGPFVKYVLSLAEEGSNGTG